MNGWAIIIATWITALGVAYFGVRLAKAGGLIVVLALLPATCGATNPVELTVSEHLDSIEVNAFHSDCDGHHVFTQLIFRDWCRQCECSHVVAWRLVSDKCPLPTRVFPRGEYETLWIDVDVVRRVRARTLDETLTLVDPELCEREVLPQSERRGLRMLRIEYDQPSGAIRPE